jgi:hypothetical protein
MHNQGFKLAKLPRQPHQKRKNCDSIYLPKPLREQILIAFEQKYQLNGQSNMSRFLNYWERKLHSKPPTAQTMRNLRSRHDRQKFEYWLIDGCCRLLLDCTYEEWEEQYRDRTLGKSDYLAIEFPSQPELDPTRTLPDRELIKAIEAIADEVHQIDLLYTDLQQKFKFLSAILSRKADIS